MRLLWITSRWGGHARWRLGDLRDVVAVLRERGHEVRVVAADASDDAPACEGVATAEGVRLRPEGRAMVRFAAWAQELEASGDHDVSVSLTSLVSADLMMPTESLWSVGLGRRRRRVRSTLSPWLRKLVRIESRAMDRQRTGRLLAFDDDLWRQVAACPSGPASPTGTLAPPVTIEALAEEERRVRVDRLRYGLDIPESDRLVVCASLRPSEDIVDAVLRAHAGLVRSGYRVTLLLATWVGYRLNDRIARLGARERVRLVGTPERLPDLLRAADLVVHPAHDGAGELLVPMALCLGRPMVVSDRAGGIDRVTDSGAAVRVLPFGASAQDWAGAIRGVLETEPGPCEERGDLIEAHGVLVAAASVEAQLIACQALKQQGQAKTADA
ncbi:glycosyltransferase [Mucisphaera calidilacus]|uniref:Glycosyl transferases group 1 n=1 Tax=Mucisphaera calidilacus TaxID=2527982 RepID=A0A518BXN7_9BACT|nr:glycosyltransferase [Mucisphaera calidilacus]QDU71739.1 Glycosyl transferases group 1 [Mucisphaera calidilacus]